MALCPCSTKDAFKKRLGVIGTSKAAERLTHALIENGVATAEAIQFHVKGGGQALSAMHMKHTDDDTEVQLSSEVMLVFSPAHSRVPSLSAIVTSWGQALADR